jgi:hypothetical protein
MQLSLSNWHYWENEKRENKMKFTEKMLDAILEAESADEKNELIEHFVIDEHEFNLSNGDLCDLCGLCACELGQSTKCGLDKTK